MQRFLGKAFTFKMESMLKDRESTRTHSEQFERDPSRSSLGCDFSVQVLSAGQWPSYRSDPLLPCSSLKNCIDAFSVFHKKRSPTQKLAWIHALGSAEAEVAFRGGTKRISGNTFQLCILELIDVAKAMSVSELAEAMKLDAAKLVKPQVASMFLAKDFDLLLRVDGHEIHAPRSKVIGDSDRFAINEAYNYKLRKFKLPRTVDKDIDAPTQTEMDTKRNLQIDSCIVRVMKSRRTAKFQDLCEESIRQLSRFFVPQMKHLKVQIDHLITRGYLERDKNDSTTFHYLA